MPPFVALFADPFIEGTELESGHVAYSVMALSYSIERLSAEGESRATRLPLFDDRAFEQLLKVKDALDQCLQIAAAQAEKPEDFFKLVQELQQKITDLPHGEMLMVPGGWDGATTRGTVIHLIEKTGPGVFGFVTCNAGEGLEYHPSAPDADLTTGKVKRQTCVRVSEIPLAKMTDSAFWMTLLAQRMKQPPGEYQRSEVLYDALLPWLAGDHLLPAMLAGEDPVATFRTGAKSGTSHYRSVWEAVRYLCLWYGLTNEQMKQFSFQMRHDMLVKAQDDLAIFATPETPFTGYSTRPVRAPLTALRTAENLLSNDGSVVNMNSLDEKTVGLYFSGHWCPPCRQFTPALVTWYARLMQQGCDFQIVFVSADRDQGAFNEYRAEMPWPALGFEHRELAQELNALCEVEGVPTLVLFRPDGTLLTLKGRELVGADPQGNEFPWDAYAEPPERRAMSTADLKVLQFACEQTAMSALKENKSGRFDASALDGLHTFLDTLRGEAAALPVADDVTESLTTLPSPLGDISAVNIAPLTNFELLRRDGMDSYAGNVSQQPTPVLANLLDVPDTVSSVPQAQMALVRCQAAVRSLLQRAADGSSSSRLVLQYQVIQLIGDLFTRVLPAPKPQAVACSMGMGKAFKAEEGTDEAAEELAKMKEEEAARAAQSAEDREIARLVKEEKARTERSAMATQLMAFFPDLDDIKLAIGALELNDDNIEHAGNWLIMNGTNAASLIAQSRAAKQRQELANNDVKANAGGFGAAEAAAASLEASALMNSRNPSEESAYRFRSKIFSLSSQATECIWCVSQTKAVQMSLLRSIHALTMTYASMWQAIESPSREFDSERSCVSLCMLSLFDAIIRMPATDEPSVVSQVLGEDGGYALSTDVCQNNRSVDKVGATMEIHAPHMHEARADALEYLSAMRRSCVRTIFDMRMPMKIEIKKYSSTCYFLKKVLARCGYPLIPRGGPRPPPEIEALCNWLFEPETPLEENQPEFGMMRDMVALYKFLTTMQTRDHELMARKQQSDHMMMSFSFSFEEGGRRAAWNMSNNPLRWEVVGFRGAPDKDTADVDCIGFYGRKLFFGEGLVVQSPCDISKRLEKEMPTEDDVLHAEELPTFGDTLSREEAELLFSFLTVDYVRLPLVLNFFADKDRVTYLFNSDLQAMLRGLLFEGGPWVPDWELAPIKRVPERRTKRQTMQEERDRFLRAELPVNRELLGTSTGLFINDLIHAPNAVLEPILGMLRSIKELTNSAVHSPDATFIVFMMSLALDVQSYIDHVLTFPRCRVRLEQTKHADRLVQYQEQLNDFLFGPIAGVLARWRAEADALNDMPTACVVHAYTALLWSRAAMGGEWNENIVAQLLGSLTFVRNWHGFGMGLLRSNYDNTTEPVDRLIRFLQAHGIDTERTDRQSLAKWTTGGRPLFLRVGRETVRAPTFASPELDKTKLPPSDVPEAALFLMLQRVRRPIVQWLDMRDPTALDRVLNKIMSVALRNEGFDYRGWSRAGIGLGSYMATSVELKFDVQSAEVLWRNDELRPVPDSMVQFNDYDSMFGREPLHCGIVRREQHRLWVHLVGKNIDLAEWDEPKKEDQGIGFPKKPEETLVTFWSCPACTMFNEGGAECSVCGTARPPQQAGDGTEAGFTYAEVVYNRPFDPYSEKPHEHSSENWFVDILKPVILHEFPPEKPMEYKLLLPADPYDENCFMVRLVGCANEDKGNATWKEVQVLRNPAVVHVYNLLPQGRRAYRSQIYTSDSRYSFHSLAVNVENQSSPLPKQVRYAAGDLKEYRKPSGSLVIMRQNEITGGRESYIPSRLLQGVVPTVLLEAFRFWQAEDHLIYGEASDEVSQWFNFRLRINLTDDTATIVRLAQQKHSAASNMSQKAKTAVSLLRHSSRGRNAGETSDEHEAALLQLVNLGFSPASSALALRRVGSDAERAAGWLFDEQNASTIAAVDRSADINHSNLSAPPLRRTNSYNDRVGTLVAEGFETAAVEHALNIFSGEANSMELAKIWLTDENNNAEILRVTGKDDLPPLTTSASTTDATEVQGGEDLGSEADNGTQWVLLDILHCTEETNPTLTRLRDVLTRVEDISHILIWGEPAGDSHRITSVELPRLKLRFSQQEHEDGEAYLHLTDASEWFLTDYYGNPDVEDVTLQYERESIVALVSGLPHSLLLQNKADEFQVLLCNHDVYRPMVQGVPFSTELVFDRSSVSWQEVMERRFYTLPVHTSKSFLVTNTLASRLYLILLKLLARMYEDAFRLAEVCAIDTDFTAEEKWVFDLIQDRAKYDQHPDAQAVRLKLILAVMYSDNKMTWEANVISDAYLKNVRHVSSSCRLSQVEELNALSLCKVANARLKNRLAMLVSQKDHLPKVDLKGDAIRIGGQPWWKIAVMQPAYLQERLRSTMHYIQYEQPKSAFPGMLKDEEVFKFLWEDELMLDEESGSNRQLGILFLYQIVRGEYKMVLFGNDCTQSFAEIFTRCFHLKHCRWGRESVSTGEQDAEASRELVHLISLLAHPGRSWPALPKDPESIELLKRGLDLHGRMMNRHQSNMIKLFFQFVDQEFRQAVSGDVHRAIIEAKQHEMHLLTPMDGGCNVNVTPMPLVSPDSLPVKVNNFRCDSRALVSKPDGLSKEDIDFFGSRPLDCINLDDFILMEPVVDDVSGVLPFDVEKNPESQTPIAKDMVNRLVEDVEGFAKSQKGLTAPRVRGLASADVEKLQSGSWNSVVENASSVLEDITARLKTFVESDRSKVAKIFTYVDQTCGAITGEAEDVERSRFRLLSLARQRPKLRLVHITSMIMSSSSTDDIRKINPYVENPEEMVDMMVEVCLRVSRIRHANRVIDGIRKVKQLINKARLLNENGSHGFDSEEMKSLVAYIQIEAGALGKILTTKRQFVDTKTFEFDPRFLVFEYVFDIVLRARQIEIVESFRSSTLNGDSRVQQMIMGAGKTTVVGPLLTLMLADGNKLVTQVMPSALLQQTKEIMRHCFASAIMPKRVYTLKFERSVDDSTDFVARLFSKLNDARLDGCVVCAAPEAIKSLALKVVEHLHSTEEFDMSLLLPGESVRENEIALDMKDRMVAKSDMADSLVKILNVWQDGILIMDEVDVLLHPLRSELNFPIGHKYPIDLSGYRWDLPIHLCDAIFYAETGKLSDSVNVDAFRAVNIDHMDLLEKLASVVRKGYQVHAIQRSPHLVLLDNKFYQEHMKPLISKWALGWLQHHFAGRCTVSPDVLVAFMEGIRKEKRAEFADILEKGLSAEAMKLLNLATDWVGTLIPHVLSKINRVSFGILTPADLAVADPRMPFSRRVMAVPFVGKDVPSRSSEFAHPDVLIGLTIISYRYSGLRRKDLQRVVTQLKQDYSRQIGPRTERPAAVLFREWINLAVQSGAGSFSPGKKVDPRELSMAVLPLPLFQPNDPVQLGRLFGLVKKLPELLHYFLRNHVFPKTMNFQKLKVSACGHELGSSILFRSRIGFSGTPSNLLPIDLGDCQYEPGSDGRITHVLTSPRVCHVSEKRSWTAQSLLKDIAKQTTPPVHALIDTGALITGMDNREVAEFLMLHLNPNMEGVVYLDRSDRKMVLMRDSGRSVSLDQCGLRPENRFTFFDQVHTTGMDIKQGPIAHAVVTVGKDMTFRDYAQGAYRMRGIGIGQTIEVYLIPEVVNRIREDLVSPTGDYLVDVPAWLLLNSMRMEGLQFVQLSLQELHNIWRKRALNSLLDECRCNAKIHGVGTDEGMTRLRRFEENTWLTECIKVFREPIGFPVEDKVPQPRPFVETVQSLVDAHGHFLLDDAETMRVGEVQEKVRATSGITALGDDGNAALNSEVVHENEKQQEEEAQKQVRQEKIKMSAFSRDDEEPKPWSVTMLKYHPGKLRSVGMQQGDSAFYPTHDFRTRKDMKCLPFPNNMWMTDNFFRPSWVGVGDRRLKNVALIMEWTPGEGLSPASEDPKELMARLFKGLVASGMPPNEAAAEALKKLKSGDFEAPPAPQSGLNRFYVALSLAEGETVRRMIHDHERQDVLTKSRVALRTVGGRLLDASPGFTQSEDVALPLCCFRFMNTDMYFSEEEIKSISRSLALAKHEDRLSFFEEGLRLRVRERNLWADTPVAKLFTDEAEWHLLGARSVADRLRGTLSAIQADGGTIPTNVLVHIFASAAQKEARVKALAIQSDAGPQSETRGVHSWTPSDKTLAECIFDSFGVGGFLSVEGLVRLCTELKVNIKLVDGVQLFRMMEGGHPDKISLSEFVQAFPVAEKLAHLPAECAVVEAITDRQEIWMCLGCTFANNMMNEQCVMCGVGWDGRRHVPRGQWECSALEGGCTKYNPDRSFYCDVCGKARPDLANVRF